MQSACTESFYFTEFRLLVLHIFSYSIYAYDLGEILWVSQRAGILYVWRRAV